MVSGCLKKKIAILKCSRDKLLLILPQNEIFFLKTAFFERHYQNMNPHPLDKLDRQILNLLQDDATTPLAEIAEKVHSSPATCQRRIRQMQDNGVILKQVVLVNPLAVGRSLSVFVAVEVESQNPMLLDKFVRSLDRENDVVSCYEISGEYDYLLLVHAENMANYHQFTRRILTSDNNVRAFKSQFVMDFNKVETKITL